MRYAIYYTPPVDHPLSRAAAQWLRSTEEPRRYGFHATLKAPFRLSPGCRVEDLEGALRSVARACAPCRIGPLQISLLRDFFALLPAESIPGVLTTAARIVWELDRFRAPMNEDELQRRLRSPLDEVERAHLANWGYPYVLDRFQFHMTLTDRVPADQHPALREQLQGIFAPLITESFELDTLYLFEQPSARGDFQIRSQFALGAGTG
jgi:Protein of unknown function (DUF1045)